MRILLTEGSSTSARQTVYALARHGHTIDLVDPQRLCLARLSRFVRRWYRCPSFTADPRGYVEFLRNRLQSESYDVLLPTHDQIYLLARFRETIAPLVGVALPDGDAIDRLQGKIAFRELLDELDLPQPAAVVVRGPDPLEQLTDLPCFVKLDFSTAGCGVWPVSDRESLHRVADQLRRTATADTELLVQQPATGEFHAVQAVFRQGELLAFHSYRGRARGVGGSAHARESMSHPFLAEHLQRLGGHLRWHGALALEYFYDAASGQPTYLEANPRIGETMNATLSGTNLCHLLAEISAGRDVVPPEPSRPGVRSHSLLMSLMGLAERGAGRTSLLRELAQSVLRRGVYRDSHDELTRPRTDYYSLLPAVYIIAQLLAWPSLARRMIRNAVENYSLNDEAVRRLRSLSVGWQDR